MDRHTPIDTRTKLVGLLGQPLGHSFSPAMHNRAFRALGLNYCYLPIEVADKDLETVTAGIAKMNFAGYNVTIPHKMRIMDCLDTIDPLAHAIGAVNTVTLQNGSLDRLQYRWHRICPLPGGRQRTAGERQIRIAAGQRRRGPRDCHDAGTAGRIPDHHLQPDRAKSAGLIFGCQPTGARLLHGHSNECRTPGNGPS